MRKSILFVAFSAIALLATTIYGSASDSRGLITGVIYDAATGEPIAQATIQAPDRSITVFSDGQGRYRLRLPHGSLHLKVTHIGYATGEISLSVSAAGDTVDFRLRPVAIELDPVSVFPHDYNVAERIIKEAIERKQEILSRIHDYSGDAYTKLILTEPGKSADERIYMITETQSTFFWEYPDSYKEIIRARKQTANLVPEENLVGVGGIENFNRNRIEIDEYSIVAPTANDALDYYNYYMLDTLFIDSHAVFLIDMEPKDEHKPLFSGEIQIVDSTFDVIAVNVRPSKGLVFPLFEDVTYSQRLAPARGNYWLPAEVRFSGRFVLRAPIPGIPPILDLEYVSSVHSYHVDEGHSASTFDEYILVVDERADDLDSAGWSERQLIPLSGSESAAYARIDSIESAPKPLGKRLLGATLAAGAGVLLASVAVPSEFYHFNRVEGPYLGVGGTPREISPNIRPRFKVGYAFSAERTQHHYGLSYRIEKRRKLWAGLSYHNEVVHRPTVVSGPSYNASSLALLFQSDPLDYFLEEGLSARVSLRPIPHTGLRVEYQNLDQRSLSVNTDFSIFGRDEDRPLDNPGIVSGTLRSLGATLSYDSRKMWLSKGRERRLREVEYTLLETGMEWSSRSDLSSDFDYRRYFARLQRRQRTFGAGVTALQAYIGASDGALPPQRYFTVDFASSALHDRIGFATLDEVNFSGNRAAMIYLNHEFVHNFFRRTSIPLIESVPFTFSAHGGVFWSEFRGHRANPGDAALYSAPNAYGEAGVGIGNLTPFISPINLAAWFTWQVSKYDTSPFSFQIGLRL